MKKFHFPHNRLIAALLVLVCLLGLFPATALAASPNTIKMDDCTHNGVSYVSPSLGTCYLHQMHFGLNGKSTMGFCAEKGKGMGWSLEGHTWGSPKAISDPTVTTIRGINHALAISIGLIAPVPPKLTLCLCGACADAFRGTGAFALREAVPGQADAGLLHPCGCLFCKGGDGAAGRVVER
nr:hypothetical protein [uncultured Oscillibacter sp.]